MSDRDFGERRAFGYDEVFRGAPDAILVMDRHGTILEANPQAERFFGYAASELAGHRASDFVVRDQLEVSNRRLDTLATGVPVEPARRVFVRADGSRVPGEIFATILPREQPAEHLLVSVIRDVSRAVSHDRLQAEQSVRLQALGTLASGVAHDLNNILASIIGFTELAHEQLEDSSEPARDLERALSAADKAKRLAAQVLAFGRRRDQRPVPVDLEQAIVQIIRLVRTTLPGGVELEFSSDHSRAVVRGDPTRLQQVVLNLCANAGKAIAANAGKAIAATGGLVRIALEAHRVQPDDESWGVPPGEYVSLSVRDTGPGVPPEISEYIFDPYFSTRTHTGGSGLGLSVVRGIVEDHRGAIRLEAAESGAHFRILLPVYHGDPVADEPVEPELVSGSGIVLVLDDEIDFVEIATRTLSRAGYSVMPSHSPWDALQLVETWSPDIDLIITDFSMPELYGDDFIARARRAGFTGAIVMVTGASPDLSAEAQRRLDIAAIIEKPVNAAALTRAVARAIARGSSDGTSSSY